MNITLEKSSNVSAVLTVKMERADYEDKVNKALKELSHKVKMPGFRPGKVPVSLVRKMYGPQAKAEEVNKLLGEKLYEYIRENKVNMLGEPLASEKQVPQDIEAQDDFEFVFDIAVAPEFKLELNQDDHVAYYDIEITDEQIDEQVKQLAQRGGHPESVDTYADRDVLRGTLAELDENGNVKEGGLQVEKVSLMPTYFNNDDQKKIFENAQKNAVVVFNPSKAYEGRDTEIASLLKVKKEEVANYAGNFSFQIDDISRFVPATLDQEFFDQVFGKDAVKSEEEFRARVKESIAIQHTADSDYKFLLDVRAYAEQKVGSLEFPDELLKKIMKQNNKEKDEKFVEENYVKSIEELKWHLIKEQLVAAHQIKVEDKDIKEMAIQTVRFQFAQYGMVNVPEEYLEQYAGDMLKKKDQVNMLVDRCVDTKIVAALKDCVTLDRKSVSVEDFRKMFES